MEFDMKYGVPDTKAAVPWVDSAYAIFDAMINYGARLSDPISVVKYPQGTTTIGGQKMDNQAVALEVVAALDGGAKVVLPSEPHQIGGQATSIPKWSVEFQTPPSTTADFVGFVNLFNEMIVLAIAGVPDMATGGASPQTGTYNLGEIKVDEFLRNLQTILNNIEEAINFYLLKPWTYYNFGADVPPVKIQFERLGRDIAQATLGLMLELLKSGMPINDLDGNSIQLDFTKIAEDNGIPYRIQKGGGINTLLDVISQRLGKDNPNE
jgi:hypothetical protein